MKHLFLITPIKIYIFVIPNVKILPNGFIDFDIQFCLIPILS
jgi:hypothetical protein